MILLQMMNGENGMGILSIFYMYKLAEDSTRKKIMVTEYNQTA